MSKSKIRISVLAKELGVKSNDLINLCQEKGFSKIHHHANTLEDDQLNLVKQYYENSSKPSKQGKSPVKKEDVTGDGKKDISANKSSAQHGKKDFSGPDKHSQPKRFVKIPQKGDTQFQSAGRQDSGKDEPRKFVKPPQKGGTPFRSAGRQDSGRGDQKKFVKPTQHGGTPVQVAKGEPKRFIRIQQKPGGITPRYQSTAARQEPVRSGVKGKDKKSFTPVDRGGQKFPYRPRPRFGNKGGYRGGYRQNSKVKRTTPVPRIPKDMNVQVEVPISVKDLSNKLGIKANNIISKLLIDHDIRATVNQNLDGEVVELLGIDFGFEITIKESKSFCG